MRVADKLTQSRLNLSRIHRLAMLMLVSLAGISPSVPQEPWSVQYGALNWHPVSNPVPSGDGGVWIAFRSGNGDFTLERRDAAGVLVHRQSRRLGGGGAAGSLQIAKDGGGFIYVAADLGSLNCPLIMQFDSQGNLNWERRLPNRCFGTTSATILTLTGTLGGGVVVGTGALAGFLPPKRPLFSRTTSSISVAKLDQQGNAVWIRNVDPPAGGDLFRLHQLIEDSETGALYFVGETTRISVPNQNLGQGVVGSLTASGNLQWIQTLGPEVLTAYGLCEWDAGTLAVVGATSQFYGKFRGYLLLVEKSGTPGASLAYYNYSNFFSNLIFRSISTLPGGAKWIVGYEYFDPDPYKGDAVVGNIDSTASFTTLVKFGGTGADIPNAQIAATEKGFALSGVSTSFAPGGRGAGFLQTHIAGRTNCLGPTVMDPSAYGLAVASFPYGATFTPTTPATGPFTSQAVSPIDPGEEVLCGSRCLEDAFEDDDTCTVSQWPLAGQTPIRHQFCDDAEDWKTVNACFSQRLDFVTADLQPAADTRLEVYGPGCTPAPLVSNDNGGGGLAAAIRDWPVPETGVYHVRLQSNTGTGAGHGTSLVVNGNTTSCQAYGSTYGGAALDTAFDVDLDAGNGVMIAGRSDSATSGGANLAILRVSADGPITETMALSSNFGGVEEARGIRRLPDGGMIVVGNGRGSNGRQDQVIFRRTAAGAVAWQLRIHEDSSIYNTEAIAVAADGTTYVMYTDRNQVLGTRTTRVVGLSSGGILVASVGFSGSGDVEGRALHVLANQDVAILVQSGDRQLELFRMPPGLAFPLWQTAVSSISGGMLAHRAIREDSRENLIVAGTFSRGTPRTTTVDLIRFSGGGQLIDDWAYTPDSTVEINGLSLRADDGIYLSGTYDIGTDKDILALRLNAAGDVTWAHRYGSTSEDVGNAVVTTLDGSPAIVGSGDVDPSPAVQRDFWLLRPDNDGNLGNACTQQSAVNVQRSDTLIVLTSAQVLIDFPPIATIDGDFATVSLTMSALTSCSGPARTMPKEISGSGSGALDAATPLLIAADNQTLTWEPGESNNSDRFTLVRGDVVWLTNGNYGDCLADNIVPSTYVDAELPEAGQAWFYLVRGENTAGFGVLGQDSAGLTRVYWGRCAQ